MNSVGEPQARVEATADGPYLVTGGAPLTRCRQVGSATGSPGWEATEALRTGEVYTLCRCGGSARKPFCDGTHRRIGFDGTGPDGTRADGDGHDGTRAYGTRADSTGSEGTGSDRTGSEGTGSDRTGADGAGRGGSGNGNADPSSTHPSSASSRLPEPAQPEDPGLPPGIAVLDDGPLALSGVALRREGSSTVSRSGIRLCRCGRSANKPFCDDSHLATGFRDAGTGPP